MAKRDLPNVYTELNDLSALIEGNDSLTVGITLRANRGPINQAYNPADSTDFLTKYTFNGKPGAKQDSTYFDIIELLKVSNNVYVSRAANNPLYGAIVVKQSEDGKPNMTIVDKELVTTVPQKVDYETNKIIFKGDVTDTLKVGDELILPDTTAGSFGEIPVKIVTIEYNSGDGNTHVDYTTEKEFPVGIVFDTPENYPIYRKGGLKDPNAYRFAEGELFMVAGIDPGAYNNKLGVTIETGAAIDEAVGRKATEEPFAFKLTVWNKETGLAMEEYLVSMALDKKSIDGTNLFIKDIVNGQSQYIQIITPDEEDIIEVVPTPTGKDADGRDEVFYLGGGSDGDACEVEDNLAALEVFGDKAIPVSLLVNGNNENVLYQAAMIAICEDRMDCFAFLRTPRVRENYILPAQRVSSLVDYKKNEKNGLGSTSYLAAMYGPHVTVKDNFNSRNVVIGADSIACKQWLKVIDEQGFPYAAAGPIDGRLNNISVDWKIGDGSGEAREFNDASMNMIVYEARQKYYYFNTQNTLQLANSAFRNVGAVLNVLEIKEYLTRALKDYIQKPISDDLQESIIRTIETYMDGCKSSGRVSDYALNNNTTKIDISNNELHFLLTLSPAYYAQKIYLVMNVVNAAFDFAILQSN